MDLHGAFDYELYAVSESVEELRQAIEKGARIIQLRDKTCSRDEIIEKGKRIIDLKRSYEFIFILNDFPDIAVLIGADGVHVGQDESTTLTRRIVGDSLVLGKTTHDIEQGRRAISDGADYVSAGPVYETPTKPGRAAVGLSYVREASAQLAVPVVAIGGIDVSTIEEVLNAGARTVAVVRALGDAPALLEKIRNRRT